MPLRVRTALLLVVPAATLLTAVIFIPELWALYVSFHAYRLETAPRFVGLENYLNLLRDPRFLRALLRTVEFVVLTIALELSVGVAAARVLVRRFRFQTLWLSLIIAPYAVSHVVSVAAWKFLLATDTGVANYLLSFLGVAPRTWLADPALAKFITGEPKKRVFVAGRLLSIVV